MERGCETALVFMKVYKGCLCFLYCGVASRCGCIVETQEGCVLEGARMRGFPHSNDPEETMKGELWVGVAPSGWSPVTSIPMKKGPRGQ